MSKDASNGWTVPFFHSVGNNQGLLDSRIEKKRRLSREIVTLWRSHRNMALPWSHVLCLFIWVGLVSACQPRTKEQVFAENDLSALTPACREQVIPHELLVRYRDGRVEKFDLEQLKKSLGVTYDITYQSTNSGGLTMRGSTRQSPTKSADFYELLAQRFVDQLWQDQSHQIDRIEYNKKIELFRGERPWDFFSSSPSGVLNSVNRVAADEYLTAPSSSSFATPTPTWATERIGLPVVHALGYRGSEVTVAIVDSRAELSHPLYQNQLLVNAQELGGQPGVDDDGNGFVDDIWGWDFARNEPLSPTALGDVHGTHVTGIIAQVAPEARLLPLAFITSDGYGSLDGAIQAMRYAKARGARVINASWGGNVCSALLEQEMRDLSDAGIFFVAASGNSGLDLDLNPQYPAVFQVPLSLTVAASRVSDYLAAYSNTSYRYVHLAAPGSDIYSSLPNGSYGYLSGTSMAAPFVSGSLAVLLSAFPTKPWTVLRTALLQTVDRLDYRVQSQGRLNVLRAIEWLQ